MADAAAPRTPGGATCSGGAPCAKSAVRADGGAGASTGARACPLRLLVLAPGSRGDVQPLLAVCRLLIRDGHSVRFVAHEVFKEAVEELNEADVVEADSDSDRTWLTSAMHAHCTALTPLADHVVLNAATRPPHGAPHGAVTFCSVHGAPLAGHGAAAALHGAAAEEMWRLQLADYSAAASLAPVDAVLFNWFGVAGVHLAEALGVPALALWPGAPLTRTRAFSCPLLPAAPKPAAGDDAVLRGYVTLEALLWRACEVPINEWRQRTLGLPPLRDGLGHFAAMARNKSPVLYGISPLARPPPADWPARVLTCGPWTLPAPRGWVPPPRLRQFLERKSAAPVVYVGFGSAALRNGADVAAACVAGAKAAGCRVLLAGGLGEGLPCPADDDDAGGDVLWIRDAPHDWLLPRCAAAVHHGGAGTCHAALRAGTPQLICPLEYDQPFWARRMRALGVAPAPLAIDAMSADAVAAALRRALSEPIRSRAAAMADELAAEEDGAAVAAAFIAAYVPAARDKKRRQQAATQQPCCAESGQASPRPHTVAAGVR